MLNLGNLGLYVERKGKSAWPEFPVENANRFCSGLKGRRPIWLLNPPSRGGGFLACCCLGFPFLEMRRWSSRRWLRLFQLWHCVRDQTEQIEKIGPPPPPYTFYFYFCIFHFFCYFSSPVLR